MFSIDQTDSVLDALHSAFSTGAVTLPGNGRVLFLRAREGGFLREFPRNQWVCEQSFKPFADGLERAGLQVAPLDDNGEPDRSTVQLKFPLVIVLAPRQRDEARALYARAVDRVAAGGTLLASVSNVEGARSSEKDLGTLCGATTSISKHKCRVFWAHPDVANINAELLAQWRSLDACRAIDSGNYMSRTGLFAWDRVDPASALLARHLPATLAGRVADLGAGYGYLSAQIISHCAQVGSIDLFEAEARALSPARVNVKRAQDQRLAAGGGALEVNFHWYDVTAGLPAKFAAIVTNPPFHIGRADRPELGLSFIDAAANGLEPGGSLWLVANRHLPYEAALKQRFGEVRCVAQQAGFKVFHARSTVAGKARR